MPGTAWPRESLIDKGRGERTALAWFLHCNMTMIHHRLSNPGTQSGETGSLASRLGGMTR
jgi:hypothetical protein